MKLTKSTLKRLIKEELRKLMEGMPPGDATDPEGFKTMGVDYGDIQKDLEKARFCLNKGFWVPIPQAKTEWQCAGYGWVWKNGHCGKCVKKDPRKKLKKRRRARPEPEWEEYKTMMAETSTKK